MRLKKGLQTRNSENSNVEKNIQKHIYSLHNYPTPTPNLSEGVNKKTQIFRGQKRKKSTFFPFFIQISSEPVLRVTGVTIQSVH